MIFRNRLLSVLCSLFLGSIFIIQLAYCEEMNPSRTRSYSLFPILIYDSDIGLGFGGKAVIKNQYHRNESFDLMVFASTRGEQRYTFLFSLPDREIRQHSKYRLSLDILTDYDKLLNSYFFGFGNSSDDNESPFPRELSKLELTLGRGWTENWVSELVFRWTGSSVYDFESGGSPMNSETPGAGESMSFTLGGRIRFDTRDSHIHPTRGLSIDLRGEKAIKTGSCEWDFTKIRIECSIIQRIGGRHLLAFRLWGQQVSGDAPYFEQSLIGGGWTLRGFKGDRFNDPAMALASIEYRYPLYRKLGGVLFIDAGRVFPDIDRFGFWEWHSNTGVGLRYYLANFVARFDIGISDEGSRFFFQFGHVF